MAEVGRGVRRTARLAAPPADHSAGSPGQAGGASRAREGRCLRLRLPMAIRRRRPLGTPPGPTDRPEYV